MLFESWQSLGRTATVCLFAYPSLIVLLRISGKRTLAKMNAFDLVVTVALGSSLSSACMSKDVPLAEAVATMALLAACQFAVAWGSVRSRFVRRLVRAEPTLLAYQGRFLDGMMRSQRVTESEIRQAARAQGIADLRAAVVVLESNGQISVLSEPANPDFSALADVLDPHGGATP